MNRTERIARAVGRLRRAMVAAASKALSQRGSPLTHWQLISAIAAEGIHSQVALAERVGMDPPATSRTLDRLQTLRLVARVRDPKDRRRITVTLTATGMRWYQATRKVVFAELAPLLAPLTPHEARTLEAVLAKVAHSSSSSPR